MFYVYILVDVYYVGSSLQMCCNWLMYSNYYTYSCLYMSVLCGLVILFSNVSLLVIMCSLYSMCVFALCIYVYVVLVCLRCVTMFEFIMYMLCIDVFVAIISSCLVCICVRC